MVMFRVRPLSGSAMPQVEASFNSGCDKGNRGTRRGNDGSRGNRKGEQEEPALVRSRPYSPCPTCLFPFRREFSLGVPPVPPVPYRKRAVLV